MLHAHIEALLHHSVLQVTIGAWTHLPSRSLLEDIALQSLELESSLLWVENSQVAPQCLRTRLLECAWPCLSCGSDFVLRLRSIVQFNMTTMSILTWSGYVEFEALSIEDLVVVESGWCLVEADVLAWENFVVSCSAFWSPLGPAVLKVIHHFIGSPCEIVGALELLGLILGWAHVALQRILCGIS